MYNPFAQVSQYFQVSFVLPFASAEHVQDSFDDIALSASAFELDEERDQWKCDVLFAEPPDMAEVTRRAAVLAMLAGKKTPAITTATIMQQDWLSLVARDFPPLIIERFFVHGSHVTDTPPVASIPIQVEAGAAFGSGEHGTTRTCLQALAWIKKRRNITRILDMGTGSGILAIAAAKLWNAEILAVDIDPIAVQVTADNVRINRTQHATGCAVSDGYKSRVVKHFGECDLIIANILARPLVMFSHALARTLKPGGYAILSGLLSDQEAMVFSAHRRQGLRLVKRLSHEGWCTLLLHKPSEASASQCPGRYNP
ncbi:MAG: 50S ribosomal protein L11 methyltransferase [Alphaproteobacteria bacterium]|nr:50S ribosomal protein L11 methyltransferase [Alphaproteobacteria bacterium]